MLRQLISGAIEDLNGKPLTRKWGPSSSCLVSVFILSRRPPVQESKEEAVTLLSETGCYLPVNLVSSSSPYTLCQAVIRD